MSFLRLRFCQNSNLFVLCSLLLAAGFLVQIKIFYDSHQKQLRLQEYKNRMAEVSEIINSVEKVANHTSLLMGRLQSNIKHRKWKKAKRKPPFS